MLDFDAGKLLIVGMVALVVIGPKDLPRVLRQFGQAVGKLRRMAGEFQGQFMEAVREADLQDLRQEVAKLKDTASIDVHFDPARDIHTELTKAIEKPVSSDPVAGTAVLNTPLAEAAASDAFPLDESSGALALRSYGPVPVPTPLDVEPLATPHEAGVLEEASPQPAPKIRRKIAPSRRRDGSRIEAAAIRDRGAGFPAVRRRPPAAGEHPDT